MAVWAVSIAAFELYFEKFEPKILEIFLPLAYGSRIAIAAPGGERDAEYLIQLAIEKSVSYVDLAPSLLDALLDHPQIQQWTSLRIISSGAEALKPELADAFYQKLSAELWNTYGPTETTVQSTYVRCVPHARAVPIGKPIRRTEAFILDESLQPVPAGNEGEEDAPHHWSVEVLFFSQFWKPRSR